MTLKAIDARRNRINRNQAIIEEALLPESTLQSVGNHWGVTRERVRQIVSKATTVPYQTIRDGLIKDTTKFCCVACGKPISPRQAKAYCSWRCSSVVVKYDFKNPKICKYCKKEFFPHRNWRSLSVRRKSVSGQYCCLKHYLLDSSRKNGLFSKDSAVVKKFTQLKEGVENE